MILKAEDKNIILILKIDIMKEKKEKKNSRDDETTELDVEVLTEIQGGIEDDGKRSRNDCGLGCFVGSGSVSPDDPTN